jgi:Fe-S-cluster containining protein
MKPSLERSEIRHHLRVLQAKVDTHFAQAVLRTPDAFACKKGCSACCEAGLSVFEVEASPIREALADLEKNDPQRRHRLREQASKNGRTHCALLDEDACSIYDARPTLCRVHGLASAVRTPEGSTQLDHCPLNYQSTAPPKSSVLVIEAVNQPLALLSEFWAQAQPDGDGAKRVRLDDLAAALD